MMGVVLVLPLLGWSLTGLMFFIKPGYSEAYAPLSPKHYPFERPVQVTPSDHWSEFRLVRTILGEHVLVKTSAGWQHLRLDDQNPWPPPGEEAIRRLVADAISDHPERYGTIERVEENVVHTDTGVRITLAWNSLSLYQRGRDTDRIDWLYKIHYLQWTGYSPIDKVVGAVGLALVFLMAVTGCWMFFRGASRT